MSYGKLPRMLIWLCALAALLSLTACNDDSASGPPKVIQTTAPRAYDLNPTDDPQSIAESAYIYAFPMLEFYRTEYGSTSNATQFNQLVHFRTLVTPSDNTVVAPNNDTLYTKAWLDLRAEPQILEVPPITGNRYYSFVFIDEYTHDIDIIGSRTTGWTGGRYLLTGPDWIGIVPDGIDKVIRSEANYILVLGRTAVYGNSDLTAVHAIQDQYKLYPLTTFTGSPALTAPSLNYPVVDSTYPRLFVASMMPDTTLTYKELTVDFIPYMNFQLGRLTPVSSEQDLMAKFAKIGIGPDTPFDKSAIPAATLASINAGILSARSIIQADTTACQTSINGWLIGYDLFGDRQLMEGRYRVRAAAALIALYGNPAAEAMYMSCEKDSNGNGLDCSGGNKYVLTFPAGNLPPNDAFWSVTMYDGVNYLLVNNPINRYKIGSLEGGYTLESDGSLKIYIQATDPGGAKTSNWLPAPAGKAFMYLRIYCPKSTVLNGAWVPPAVVKTP